MKNLLATILIALSLCLSAAAQINLRSPRVKNLALPDRPIMNSGRFALATGYWIPDSDDSKKALAIPMQVMLKCYGGSRKECVEFDVTLAGMPNGPVIFVDTDTSSYDITSWDETSLTASYGGDFSSPCQRHVLTIEFKTGIVTVTDIPTHKKTAECAAFQTANGYKLQRGMTLIDVTRDNSCTPQHCQADKP